MSNYRDDSHDIAVASDSTWLGLLSVTESTARATAALIVGIGVLHTDVAVASDELLGRGGHTVVDSANVSDQVIDHLSANQVILEKANAKDWSKDRLLVLHNEEVAIKADVIDGWRGFLTDSAIASDEIIAQRYSFTYIVDRVKVSDKPIYKSSTLIEDTFSASDWATGKLRAKSLHVDSANIASLVIDQHHILVSFLNDKASVGDYVSDHLLAKDIVEDSATVIGELTSLGISLGQAWTANTETWAMSRYEPYSFDELAVIDGILYGINHEGVYQLTNTEPQSPISAKITTGKIDVSNGSLAHPIATYIEHELVGSASMDITTTQDNIEQTYTYPLTGKPAEYMNSGRFIFGRGLRGRHFEVGLNLEATKAHINDLSLNVEPVKRRV